MGKGKHNKSGSGTTTLSPQQQYENQVEELAQALAAPYGAEQRERGEYPFSNSDLEAAVEAYAMTHKGVDENQMLEDIRNRSSEIQSANMRTAQIDSLESSWNRSGGNSKAIRPTDIQKGDIIGGETYSFRDGVEAPDIGKSKWSGDYNGAKMNFSADNTFKVTDVKRTGSGVEVVVEKIGGAGGTAKKKFKQGQDIYVRKY